VFFKLVNFYYIIEYHFVCNAEDHLNALKDLTMNVTTPFKRLPIVAKSLGIGLFLVSSLFAATQPLKIKYDTLIYVPVTFYDYHPNGTFGFEQCMSPAGATVAESLVQKTIQLPGGKPLATALACNTTTPSTYPCACSLNEWFKPTGYKTATNLKFEQVQTVYLKDTISAFRWTGLTRNATYSTAKDTFFTLPGWDSNTEGANLVYYSYLPFKLIDADKGTYEFNRTGNNQFFWLDNIGYGNEGRDHNFSFTMELHQEFTYQGDNSQAFQFSGDDDVWVFINGKLALDLGGVHGEQQRDFSLNATKAAELGLEPGKKYWLDVFYTERHTIQSNCRITSNLLRPYLDTVIVASAPNLCPGDTNIITAKILDKDNIEMTWLEDSVRWEIISPTILDSNDKLIDTKGKKVRFTAKKAWRNITVRASVYDPYLPEQKKYATVTFSIDVCKADHIVIEGSPTPRKWGDDPLKVAIIGSKDTMYNKLYAVLRDSLGNLADTLTPAKWFTSYTSTQWTSANTNIATVQGENGKTYHGTAYRANIADSVIVTAKDGTYKPGTVTVKIEDYYIVKLRLVDLKTGSVVDTLRIETDSIGHYKVEGLKSTASNPDDPSSWVDVSAKFDLKDTLKSALAIPTNSNTWDYDPTNHGKGRLILTNPNSTLTDTTIIPVIVTLSKPKLYLQILTPVDKRIAGDTIMVRAYIENTDGLIPIPYCFGGNNADIKDSIAYFDNLGRGSANRDEPFTIVNDKVLLNFDQPKFHTSQCFKDGSDTFGLVLYYAPFEPKSDSLHVLSAWAGNLQAKTDPFKLLPGPLNALKFENNSWVEYQGPIELDPTDPTKRIFSTFANGYDKYGNRIGHEPTSEWSVTGTLDPEKLSAKVGEKNTYRTDENDVSGLSGNLVATAKGINDSTIVASIQIKVKEQQSIITSAITRDLNGNGRLDRIDITFNKKTRFTMDEGTISLNNFSPNANLIENNSVIDSIIPANMSGLEYYIYFAEKIVTPNSTKPIEVPQTGWTPKLTLSNFAEAANSTVTVSDGAAPVVWQARKQIINAFDRTKDIITIVLSEKISKGGGSNLVTAGSKPSTVFKIWEKVNNNFSYEDSMLIGITNFEWIKEDSGNVSIFMFKMYNGNDIIDNDWVNIFDQNRLIADEKGNYTHALNQKVKFDVYGQFSKIEIIPNPARPSTQLTEPGVIKHVDSKEEAYKAVRDAGGGVMIKITTSNASKKKVFNLRIKVYDVVGNQVASCPTETIDLTKKKDRDTMTVVNEFFIWGGINEKGMKIAPGRYKVIAWFMYNSPFYKDETFSLELGITK
jgi:fibro-slime domain-containing protein